ncbi:MAG: hypothetical protein J7J44_04320 [Deltaproteobacteria bacterium]|nr:hypothetical protein [Deltaproteobacteria bacterium]
MRESIIYRVRDYMERASRYFDNFEQERRRGEKEKAGEALWGVVSCLLNAFFILEKGKPASKHGVLSDFAQQFLISSFKNGEELARVYKKVEKFHANFYHAFLDKAEFEELCADILTLVGRLDIALKYKLQKLEL